MARVLIIAYTTYLHDGRVKRHAEALAARGDKVDVIALSSGKDGPQNGVNVIGIGMPRYRGASPGSYLASYLRFFSRAALLTYRLSRARAYDLVITCTMPDTAVLAALPARLFGSRVILDVHDTMPELYQDKFAGRRGAIAAKFLRTVERLCAGLADRVFAVHEPHSLRLQQSGVPSSKISVVMNSPHPRIFNAAVPPRHDDGFFDLVCHGTMTQRLGIDIAIEAVRLLADRIPKLRLRVIGAGDYLEQARNLAGPLVDQKRVLFEGMLPIEELPAALRSSSIGIVPNRDSRATRLMLPVKLLEYATLGVPVIASRLPTVEHYFPESSVRLVTPGDAAALARAIEELYNNPAHRARLAEAARRVVAQFGWPCQQQVFFSTIDSLIAHKAGPGTAYSPPESTSRRVGRVGP